MPPFWQLAPPPQQSTLRVSMAATRSTPLAWAAGAGWMGAPGGAVAVRLAAWAAGTVPGSTWNIRNTLVGTSATLPAVLAAAMALTLVSVLHVAGSVVATTSTFHHSGRPLLRVPTTWLWAGIGTL